MGEHVVLEKNIILLANILFLINTNIFFIKQTCDLLTESHVLLSKFMIFKIHTREIYGTYLRNVYGIYKVEIRSVHKYL